MSAAGSTPRRHPARLLLLLLLHVQLCTASHERRDHRPSHYQVDRSRQCYNLPYGAVGFISHMLSYYALLVLCCGLRPLQPWRRNVHAYPNLGLTLASCVPGIVIPIITMVRCRHEWQFVLNALSRLIFVLILGGICFRAAVTGCRRPKSLALRLDTLEPLSLPIWLLVDFLGTIFAFAGTVSLAAKTIREGDDVLVLTCVLGGVTVTLITFSVIVIWHRFPPKFQYDSETWTTDYLGYSFWSSRLFRVVLASASAVLILSLLVSIWSDWVIGAVGMDRFLGRGQEHRAEYWSFFAFQLLPLFFT